MSNLILPGLIDPHVHFRDPGQTYKEDFYTGTCAALAGGYTTIIDMPNNKIPITTLQSLDEKIAIAKEKIVCDVGFYFGSLGDKLDEFKKVKDKVVGLKLYLNQTTGNFLIAKQNLKKIFLAWRNTSVTMIRHSGEEPRQTRRRLQNLQQTKRFWMRYAYQSDVVPKPILVHAEGKTVEDVIYVVKKIKTPTHFCHISTASEVKMILTAKEQGLPITCGVTPHHLFLTENGAKALGPFGKMKPPLRSKKDVEFLWKNINLIDVIESDHAPHTIGEKEGKTRGDTTGRVVQTRFERDRQTVFVAPFGVPGLETTLPLLLTAVSENRLTIEDVIRLCFKNPARIFSLGKNCVSRIEVDLNKPYSINSRNLFTKCRWSPFDGWRVKGKVLKVFIRGKRVFEDGKVLVKPGFGKIITPHRQ